LVPRRRQADPNEPEESKPRTKRQSRAGRRAELERAKLVSTKEERKSNLSNLERGAEQFE